MDPISTSTSTTKPPPKLDFDFHITTMRLYISHIDPTSDLHCSLVMSLMHEPTSQKYNPSAAALVTDMESTRQTLEIRRERLSRTGWGPFLVSLKPQDESSDIAFSQKVLVPIGMVSMQQDRFKDVQGPIIPDVGFAFLRKYHGKGYATEAVLALMQRFREQKGLNQFAAMTDPQNEFAKKLLKRLNFECRGDRVVTGVVDAGKATELSVWTLGVDDGEEALHAAGLGTTHGDAK